MGTSKLRSLYLAAFLSTCGLLGAPVDVAVAASQKSKAPQASLPAAKNIDDCERFKEPLAYNACLASFGPMRNGGGAMVTPEVASDADRAEPGGAKASGSRYSRRDRRYSRSRYNRHTGRTSATFSVPDSIISGNGVKRR